MKLDKPAFGLGCKWTLLSAFAIFASLMEPVFATDWYADAVNGDDAYDGTSAATAKKTIQAAIDLTDSGDTVYVAPGRYNSGVMTCAFNGVTARVVITNKINLVATGKRDETFIDGGAEMRCIYVYNSSSSPKYTKAAGSVFRGFTLCNGKVTGSSAYGAGAYIPSCYVIDCAILGNTNAAYRGGGTYLGTAIRCLYANNYADGYGSAAQQTVLLNCVVTSQRGKGRLFSYAGVVVNCTIVGNTASEYTYSQNSNCYLYNTIYAGNSSQKFQVATQTVASNCVFAAGTTAWSEDLCGNIVTDVPEYCFAGPALDDWRPTAEFNIGQHGDAAFLTKVSLPAELESERYIDYNGKPISQTGAITCGAVQENFTPSRALLKVGDGFEVRSKDKAAPIPTHPSISTFRYLWTEAPGIYQMRKAGAGIGGLVWYTMSTNSASFTTFLPDTNNWVLVATRSSLTNSVSAILPDKTYYVDAALGDDSYEGSDIGTEEHPYATIQAAIDAAPTGTKSSAYKNYVIVVRKGEYRTGGTEDGRVFVPNKVGSTWQYRNFRIVSEEGPEKTFIIGEMGAGDNGLGEGALRCVRSTLGTFIQGFTLTGGYAAEGAAFNSNATGNGALADCIVSNNCSGASIIYRVRAQRCRIEGNKITSSNVGDVRDSIVTMSEIVQSSESVASSYAVVGTSSYVRFSAVKGRCNTGSHFYASILGGGQSIGTSGGYAKYCFAHGDALIDATGTAVQNCQNGKSRCLNFPGGDFRLRSDSPAIGLLTFDPDTYYAALTLDLDGNLPPLDTLEGWTVGPRQQASVEWHARGATFVIR